MNSIDTISIDAISAERAAEIWNTRGPFGSFTLSAEEDAAITAVYQNLPGSACWADALLLLARPIFNP